MVSTIEAYNQASPTIRAALRLYCDRLITLIEDEEIKRGSESIKDDLFEHLGSIQYILSNLSYLSTDERFKNVLETVYENKNTISNILSFYKRELENSKKVVESYLEEAFLPFPNHDIEIDKIQAAMEYVRRMQGYC